MQVFLQFSEAFVVSWFDAASKQHPRWLNKLEPQDKSLNIEHHTQKKNKYIKVPTNSTSLKTFISEVVSKRLEIPGEKSLFLGCAVQLNSIHKIRIWEFCGKHFELHFFFAFFCWGRTCGELLENSYRVTYKCNKCTCSTCVPSICYKHKRS